MSQQRSIEKFFSLDLNDLSALRGIVLLDEETEALLSGGTDVTSTGLLSASGGTITIAATTGNITIETRKLQ